MTNRQLRLALANHDAACGSDPSIVCLAMLASQTARGCRVQHFRTRACFCGSRVVERVTGLPTRHLDAWLMPKDVCQSIFAKGAKQADMVLVEGAITKLHDVTEITTTDHQWDEPNSSPPISVHDPECECVPSGALSPIVNALGLPMVAVIPCDHYQTTHLTRRPEGAHAVILDGLENEDDYPRFQTLIEAAWNLPVLGAVEALPQERQAIRFDDDGFFPDSEARFAIDRLAQSFSKFADFEALDQLASSLPLIPPRHSKKTEWQDGFNQDRKRYLLLKEEDTPSFRVAFAFDEAFSRYHPETLEALRAMGAELIEFSPLRDEALPHDIDLILIGCGCPDLHADDLARNHSLIADLQAFARRGGRIYAEGGGAAYLARQWTLADGRTGFGAGLLAIDAVQLDEPSPSSAVVRSLSRSSWLGRENTCLRGYRNRYWQFKRSESDEENTRSGMLSAHNDVVFRNRVIGSLIHLHLAALPELLAAFANRRARLSL